MVENLQVATQSIADLKSFFLKASGEDKQAVSREIKSLVLFCELNLPSWPDAIEPALICSDTEEDKFERADGILDLIITRPLTNLRFLDFGCGEGHVVIKSAERGTAVSVGYDIKRTGSAAWEVDNPLLTTDLEKVAQHGPFDVILLYDVLDHAENISPSEILQQVKSLLAKDGRVYVRCHPWCGRHGGHLYRQINKAFVHLVLTTEELAVLGVTLEHTLKIIRPFWTYKQWVSSAGLVQESQQIVKNPVESFFHTNETIRSRIQTSLRMDTWPSVQLEQSFVDMVLKKP